MTLKRLLRQVLKLEKTVIEGVRPYERTDALIVSVRPFSGQVGRCPECHKKAKKYDQGIGRRRWRCLDWKGVMVYIEAAAPRVICPDHGVRVQEMPWARPGSWFTKDFEQQVAWLAVFSSRKVVAEAMRIDWATVGTIIGRVQADEAEAGPSPLENLVEIGIDETSHKKGHKYVTVVVNHNTGYVVWVGDGHGKKVLERFFTLLTNEQKQQVKVVTADGAKWIKECVEEHCPNATLALDPYHTVSWATAALDEVRRQAWREARKQPKQKRSPGRPRKGSKPPPDSAKDLKGSRWALLKNPENLTERQEIQLEMIAVENPVLHRAWQLKEKLRLLLKLPLDEAQVELRYWLSWAQRCRIPAFVELGQKVKRHLPAILDAIKLKVSNARLEAINNKIKLTIRMAYGFRNVDNLISYIMLRCGGLELTLPGRESSH